ncbi:hypothetical protein AB0Y14_07185 [Rothia sp. HC945]|uniref:hypothetical protein n=1 Tax=Rothia sp. HC945 TaxID=3171170 RepID=UPI002656F123|nr:hypothetical protein [Kocuria sp.]MDN5653897.1 hypothetical protein [Kocuria sp.]
MAQHTETHLLPHWGYTKVGSRKIPAWKPALALGLLTDGGASVVATLLTTSGSFNTLAFFVFLVFLWAPLTMLWWVALVDRKTVRGATRDPEKSIESTWYSRAAEGVFHDLMIIMGLGAVVTTWWRPSFDMSWFFLGACVVMMLDFALRYAVIKARS